MSTVLLQQQHVSLPQIKTTSDNTNNAPSLKSHTNPMAWSNQKLRFSCIENIGLKQLWKLIVLDSNAANTTANKRKTNSHKQHQQQLQRDDQQIVNQKLHIDNCVNLADYLSNRDVLTPSSMSLLKFLAINALELSAPATPLLLQQQNQTLYPNEIHISQQHHHYHHQQQEQDQKHQESQYKQEGWMQLSGHPESIVPTASGIVRKRVTNLTTDHEVLAYKLLSMDPQTSNIVPHFYGTKEIENESFIELQDLLTGFKDPCVMDIKLGCRTFLESEVTNQTLRNDLYKKMTAVDENAPTPEEHEAKAITKLRYMLFREAMSSSHSKGFRIEALRLRGRTPMKDLKTVRSSEQISQTIQQFLGGRRDTQKLLIQRLKHIRSVIEKSEFFHRHEIIGSSIFIVYDDVKVGAWLIDFAKSRQLPPEIIVNHRNDWIPGNCEEGILKGMDKLIDAFESACDGSGNRKCLHI